MSLYDIRCGRFEFCLMASDLDGAATAATAWLAAIKAAMPDYALGADLWVRSRERYEEEIYDLPTLLMGRGMILVN